MVRRVLVDIGETDSGLVGGVACFLCWGKVPGMELEVPIEYGRRRESMNKRARFKVKQIEEQKGEGGRREN